jgi:hypothetical protein
LDDVYNSAIVTPPIVVCVLGMHRSGTSLVARLTNLLGVNLGDESEIVVAAPDNPRGFWEHPRFRTLNDELLARLGVSWDTVETLPPAWQDDPSLNDLREQARSAIEIFAGEPIWGWKDPRTCVTLPFWQPLAPPMRYVICLRSVLDVAHSLADRNGLTINSGAKLWFHYTASALERTSGAPRICIFSEDVVSNPREQAGRLSRFIHGDDRPAAIETNEIGEAVDAELHHHRSSLADVAGEAALPDAAKTLYLLLRTVTPEALASAGFDGVLATLREVAGERGPADIIGELRSVTDRLDRALDERTIELADRSRELDERTRELDERTRELAERADELAARLIELQERDRRIVERDRQIEEGAREISVLTGRCEGNEARIATLTAEFRSLSSIHQTTLETNQELASQLQTIYNSRAWRWLTEYRRMRRRFDRRSWNSQTATKRT